MYLFPVICKVNSTDRKVVTRIQLEMLAEQDSHAALIDWLHGLTDFPVFRPSVPADPAGDQSRDQDPD